MNSLHGIYYQAHLEHENSLYIKKISPIFNTFNPKPNLTGPNTPQYGNYPFATKIFT